MPDTSLISILLHVGDWRTATDWYASAFPAAKRRYPASDDFGLLLLDGIALEIVNADSKVRSGAAGTVLYWRVGNLTGEVQRLQQLGATLYRGPLHLDEGDVICQVQDPWGNCIGLRQIASGTEPATC